MIDVLQFLLLMVILAFLWNQRTESEILPRKKSRVIVDTCALIDGRIVELAKGGFLPGTIVVPEFILHELQLLADGADAHKRSRARYGLDIVHELQENVDIDIVIDKTAIPNVHAVDNKLVVLAKKFRAPLYTTDYNLGKVAAIDGVKVLNVHELAQNLRPTVLPGEQKMIKIVQKGNTAKQGAGYLDDGTLVIVDGAAQFIGKVVKAEITKTHQTASGKMLFGELKSPRIAKKSDAPTMARRSTTARTIASRLKR